MADGRTSAQVTYDFTPLDPGGAAVSEASAQAMFADELVHWEQAINDYLASQ